MGLQTTFWSRDFCPQELWAAKDEQSWENAPTSEVALDRSAKADFWRVGLGAAENREIAEGGIEVQGPASFLFSLLKMMGVVTFLPEAPVWV